MVIRLIWVHLLYIFFYFQPVLLSSFDVFIELYVVLDDIAIFLLLQK